MTRRRVTRKAPVCKPKAPEGDEGKDLSLEEKKLKLQTYLADYDEEVERRRQDMKEKAEKICQELHNMMMLEIIKIPSSIREMKFSDFMAHGGNIHLSMMEATKATLKEVEIPDVVVKPVKRGRMATSQFKLNCETISEESDCTDDESSKKTTVKRPPRPRRKATVSYQDSTAGAPATAKTTRRMKVLVEQTPANQIRGAAAFTDTPLLTPRIDPRLLTTPGFSRLPRKQEKTLYCQISETTGSPIKDNNLIIIVSNGELKYVNKETGEAKPLPVETMKPSDRTIFHQFKSFLSNLPGIGQKTD